MEAIMPRHVPGYNPPIPSAEVVFENALRELRVAHDFLEDETSPQGEVWRNLLIELCQKISSEQK